jgi:hypothetical protein
MATRTTVSALSTRESILDAVDNIRATSIDPYVTFRSTYGILRESAIRNGPMDVQELPEFEEVPLVTLDVPLVTLEVPLGSSVETEPPVGSSAGVQPDSGLLPILDLDTGGR